jgi:dipeptidyl aminopeptidase/acylaminoacyl peptidase
MPNYDKLKHNDSNPRIFTEKSPWDLALYEGMLDLSDKESPDAAMRRRYIDRNPDAGKNALFILDLTTKQVRRLSLPGHGYVFASWSPDGGTIAAVRIDDQASDYQPHTQTSLSLFNIRTGEERSFTTAFPIIANPQWLGEKEILLFAKVRWLDGWKFRSFNPQDGQWRELPIPQRLVPIDFRVKANKTFLLETYDRFVPAIWKGRADGTFIRMNTHGFAGMTRGFAAFDSDRSGNLFLVADGPTFTGRVVLISSRGEQTRTIFDPNPQLSGLEFGKQERISWKNDEGDDVDGVIIYPPNYRRGQRYPVVVDLYPVPARDGFNLLTSRNDMPAMGQAEAALGYIVFKPGLRAPHTPEFFSRDVEYNEKARGVRGIPIMLDDLRSGLKFLDDHKLSDPDRVCIFGHSNGGWVANFVITSRINVRCAVISEGTSDLLVDSLMWSAAPGGWLDNLVTPDSMPIDRSDEIRALSPIHKMENVHVPVLLVTGDKDWLSWTPQMIMEYNALRLRHKSVTLLRYANEGHNFHRPASILDAMSRVHDFFAQYLGRSASSAANK